MKTQTPGDSAPMVVNGQRAPGIGHVVGKLQVDNAERRRELPQAAFQLRQPFARNTLSGNEQRDLSSVKGETVAMKTQETGAGPFTVPTVFGLCVTVLLHCGAKQPGQAAE